MYTLYSFFLVFPSPFRVQHALHILPSTFVSTFFLLEQISSFFVFEDFSYWKNTVYFWASFGDDRNNIITTGGTILGGSFSKYGLLQSSDLFFVDAVTFISKLSVKLIHTFGVIRQK